GNSSPGGRNAPHPVAQPSEECRRLAKDLLRTSARWWGHDLAGLPDRGAGRNRQGLLGGGAEIGIEALPGLLSRWPVFRQIAGRDRLALGEAAASPRSRALRPRTEEADRVVRSVCPYCAVGCGQLVYVKDGQVTQIEGDPDSPISRGRLCPKGSASKELVTRPDREVKIRYRRPHGRAWEELSLERAMGMIADRVIPTRAA